MRGQQCIGNTVRLNHFSDDLIKLVSAGSSAGEEEFTVEELQEFAQAFKVRFKCIFV